MEFWHSVGIFFHSTIIYTVSSGIWHVWNSTCYTFSDETLAYLDAIYACTERNSTILMVETLEEHRMILPFTQQVSYWIGGSGNASSGEFKWFNDESILDSLWMEGKPDRQGECVRYRLRQEGLANSKCNVERKYICERSYHLCLEGQNCCVDQTSTMAAEYTTDVRSQTTTEQETTSEQTPSTQLTITRQKISTEEVLISSQGTSIADSKPTPNTAESTASQQNSITDLLQPMSSTGTVTQQNVTAVSSQATQTESMADSGVCHCQCFRNDTQTEDQILKEYKEIIKSITRPKHTTSLAIRKLNCANDPRVSAAAMGYIGLTMIIIPVALIVMCDIQRCFMKTESTHTACGSVNRKSSPDIVPDISSV